MKLRGVSILLLHGALVVWLTWPLAAGLGTTLPDPAPICRADVNYAVWALS
jgi:hypothetical protein